MLPARPLGAGGRGSSGSCASVVFGPGRAYKNQCAAWPKMNIEDEIDDDDYEIERELCRTRTACFGAWFAAVASNFNV